MRSGLFDEIVQDLRFALRSFTRNPELALVATVTLALGIGATTAVFSVVNAVLLRPVAAPNPDQIVVFGTARDSLPPTGGSPTRYNAWRELDAQVQDIAAYRFTGMNLTGPGEPRRVQVAQVSEAYFRLFGLPAARGRTFAAEEDLPNAGGFAVLSDAFAKQTFGSEDAIGRRVLLGGEPHAVIGVLRAGARAEAPEPVDIWIPFQIDPQSQDQSHFFAVAGRKRPGVTAAEIETRLELASSAFAEKFPDIGARLGGSRFVVQPIQELVGRSARPALLVLLGAVTLVLLIACGNVANLLLARGATRDGEMALRAGLGASRGRLVRQLLAETGLLWIVGTAAGVGVGLAGVRLLLRLEGGSLPRITEGVSADWRVFGFAAVASLATAAVFALYPALHGSRTNLRSAMQRDRTRARSALVVGEIALALTLAIASGLLIRSFFAMRSVEPGFDAANVLTMQALLDDPRYGSTAGLSDLVTRSAAAIEAIPGVEAATAGCCLPVGSQPNVSFRIVARPDDGGPTPRANVPTIAPGYFRVTRIPLLQGRSFTAADNARSPKVVIVNQALARIHWPEGGVLGASITIGAGGVEELEVVGVVGDVRDRVDGLAGPAIYTPLAQSPDGATAFNVRRPTHWMIRTSGDAALVRDAVRAEIERASGLPVLEVRTLEQVIEGSTAAADFRLALMLAFGAFALLLAAAGVYGLVSFEVAQRRTEVGVRLALGAGTRSVVGLVAARSGKLAAMGLGLGLAAAFALAGLMESMLFGVDARDPLIFVIAPLALGLAALAATLPPAFRAGRLDPVIALRGE